MTDALALTRSKAKHPPDKTVAEARRIRSKVEKSNTNRRRKKMKLTEVARRQAEHGYTLRLTDGGGSHWEWVGEDEARRDAAIFQKLTADLPKMEAFIDDLDREAAITGEGTEGMRLSGARLLEQEAVRLTQSGDADDYPSAVRQAVGSVSVARSEADEEEVHGSVHYMDEADYQQQLKQTMKERGYDV